MGMCEIPLNTNWECTSINCIHFNLDHYSSSLFKTSNSTGLPGLLRISFALDSWIGKLTSTNCSQLSNIYLSSPCAHSHKTRHCPIWRQIMWTGERQRTQVVLPPMSQQSESERRKIEVKNIMWFQENGALDMSNPIFSFFVEFDNLLSHSPLAHYPETSWPGREVTEKSERAVPCTQL